MSHARLAANDRQPAERADAPAARDLIGCIRDIVGEATLLDTAFPLICSWNLAAQGAAPVLRVAASVEEQRFLERFRHSGGHAPIAAWRPTPGDGAWSEQGEARQACIVIGLPSHDFLSEAASLLHDRRHALLLPARGAQAAKDKPRLRGYRTIRLIERSGGASFHLLAPHEAIRGPSAGGARTPPRDAELFDGCDLPLVVEARSMIHDGGYASEGDAGYSWLWTGPSHHFRIIVPRLAGSSPGRVELCVPRTEDRANLDSIAVQIDGRPVAHSVDRWSETSGKLCFGAPEGAPYSVVTVVVPRMTADGGSGRLLGVCIDKMIIAP